eukprot:XP_019925690.1 PREDICTED: serine/threonine-protein phosphatase 6 regulatory ankyrin repeat subunit C-like isoform X3 [Crassostrea gigas]
MFEQVKNQPYVTFVGTPGSGKSATAHHIALKLQNEEGYDILPIKEVSKIEDYCDPESPQVFVIDDVVGVFGLNNGQFEMLERYKDRIISADMSKTKIIMTCREVVFRNETLSKCFLTENANVIKLQSEDNKLSDEDKLSLLANYGLDVGLIPSKGMSETSAMFPFLCKMFSEQKFNVHGYRFFITPIKYIKDALDDMQTRNQMHYFSLVLLMLHQNKLSETDLVKELIENKPIDINDVFRKCKVSSHKDSFKITGALQEMDGTYTQTCDDQFCFIHDSMFEIVACQFGRQFPELIFKYMSSEYIANYINVGTNDGEINENESEEMLENIEHLSITLHDSKLPMFAERLFIDLKDGKFIGIFKSLKHPSVMQAFQTLIKEKQYDELFTAFLSNQKDEMQWFFFRYSSLEISHEYANVFDLLTGGLINNDEHNNFVRVIRYFVLRGQHGILQHIIDQMMIQRGNINDLFQPFCNKEQQSGQGMNEDATAAEVERTEDDVTTVETTTTKNKIQKKSSLCFKDADTDEEIVNNDYTRTGYKDSESDRKSDIGNCIEQTTVEQWRLLCIGCHSGDVNTVKILLKCVNKAILNMYLKDQLRYWCSEQTPLNIACKYGYFDIAKELIRAGTNVNQVIDDKYEQSHLFICFSKGHWDIAKELIKAGADVNKRNAFRTPLIDACENNNLSGVRLLIKAGANLNLKARKQTPLQVSYDAENLRIADELIKAGANANSANGVQSSTKTSCDDKSKKIEMRNNADIDINPNQKKTSTKYKTPLIIACENRDYLKVRLLIEAGADIHKSDGHRTPLAVACQNSDLKIIKILIKAGADVNPVNAKMSPLMVACNDGDLKCVQDWIKKGALLNLKTENGTPLIIACKRLNSVFEELIKRGADVNLEANGEIPLTVVSSPECYFCASFHENPEIYRIKSLIQAGVDVNLKVGDKTPLIIACQVGHVNIVEVLIKAGADVNLEAGEQTPLTAVLHSYETRSYFRKYLKNKIDVVKVLLQAGADFNQKAGDETPLLVACRNGYTDVVDEFIKTEADFKLASHDETHMTDVCKETNINVKEWLDKMETDFILGLQCKSQLLTACLLKQLTIADLFKADGDCITGQDDNNKTHRSKCLIEELGEDKSLIKKSGVNANPKNVMSFLMKTACQIGQLNLVKELVEVGVDINLIDGNETPLIISCQRGHVTVIKELIKAGVDVNTGAGCNYPLIVACEKMHIDAVKELIQAGAVVNLESSKKTPLTTVCELHNRDVFGTFELQKSILEALIKAGSDVDMKAGDETPLIIVCKRGNVDAVELLLESGADVNLAAGGVTPLTAACKNCQLDEIEKSTRTPFKICILDVVEELIKAGANVNQKDAHKTPLITAISSSLISIKCIEFVIKAGADVNLKDKDHTPLTLACEEGNLRIVAALIDAGADVNLKAWRKRPITVACTEGHFDVVKYLIQRGTCVNLGDGIKTPLEIAYERKFMRIAEYLVNAGASINLIKDVFAPITVACQMGRINDVRKMIKAGTELNPTNVDKTPLTAACQKRDLSLVKELINAGASVDLMDRFSTPLTTACLWGHLSVVKELIIAGASVDKIDKYNTPLTTACLWGHLDIVKELIRAGSNVNLRDVSNTPLTTACYWGELDIVKELIESDVDVNLQDEENTPLTIACVRNRIDIVKELIKAKANVNVEAGGNTPLTAACKGGDLCIVEMLIKAGADVNLGVEVETTDTDGDTDEYSTDGYSTDEYSTDEYSTDESDDSSVDA